MTTTIKWSIFNLDRNTDDCFITTAHWQATGEDDGITSSVYATCAFQGDVTTSYENVTEAQVLEWCWANGVDKEATEAAVAAQIEAQKNPVTASGTPWSA